MQERRIRLPDLLVDKNDYTLTEYLLRTNIAVICDFAGKEQQ